jgi:hypothetical protein
MRLLWALEESMDSNIWLKNIDRVALCSTSVDYKAKKAFKAVLNWIVKNNYRGGCHDTSAALHMLLGEQGVKSSLCIGEVKIDEQSFFDHSWVTVDDLVLDASVCMPNIGGYAFPPVFASKDLLTLDAPQIYYGERSPVGFDSEAKFVSSASLSEYSSGHPDDPNKLWSLTKTLAKEAGVKVNAGKLKDQYGAVMRHVVCA